jgi:sucrose phosphorylase
MPDNKRIRQLLTQIYNPEITPSLISRLDSILNKYRGQIPEPRTIGLSERDVILIVYPDQVQEPNRTALQSLNSFCGHFLRGLITGIHLLPFYPWSSDDGFSVIDHQAVAQQYGSWADVKEIGKSFRLMFDAVINHISIQSPWFQGFLQGNKDYQDYFIEVKGNPDLSGVIRPRALPLLSHFNSSSGSKAVWTTFSDDQADLNYHNPNVLMEILDILLYYTKQGAEFIRLDAIAYLWKEIGTNCMHLPQTHLVVQLIRAVLDEIAPQIILITETNVPHAENISYFGDGNNEAQLVYNFSLPPLVLHAFQTGDARVLSHWASGLNVPAKNVTFFNFLASHDGVGLNPLRGILPEAEVEELAHNIELRGGLISYKSNADNSKSPYEVNVNYLDALSNPGEPVELTVSRFITAHAILLAFIGIPGIYFHSMFGLHGWPEGVALTGRNRSINREKFNGNILRAQLDDGDSLNAQVFSYLSHLITTRANHPAFTPYGIQRVLETGSGIFALLRVNTETEQSVLCLHNVSAESIRVKMDLSLIFFEQPGNLHDLISGEKYNPGKTLSLLLTPYQSAWLTK